MEFRLKLVVITKIIQAKFKAQRWRCAQGRNVRFNSVQASRWETHKDVGESGFCQIFFRYSQPFLTANALL